MTQSGDHMALSHNVPTSSDHYFVCVCVCVCVSARAWPNSTIADSESPLQLLNESSRVYSRHGIRNHGHSEYSFLPNTSKNVNVFEMGVERFKTISSFILFPTE
jgi:hypothetical protein